MSRTLRRRHASRCLSGSREQTAVYLYRRLGPTVIRNRESSAGDELNLIDSSIFLPAHLSIPVAHDAVPAPSIGLPFPIVPPSVRVVEGPRAFPLIASPRTEVKDTGEVRVAARSWEKVLLKVLRGSISTL